MKKPITPGRFLIALALLVPFVLPPAVAGQHEKHPQEETQEPHDHPAKQKPEQTDSSEEPAGHDSLEPRSTPQWMWHRRLGGWGLMVHGNAFLVATQQSGPQGRDKIFGINWLMTSLNRGLGGGSFTLRTMLSLEPLTVTDRQYPLLFQTGETAFGQRLINGQHPHDLVMELALRYARPVGERTTLILYGAPVGQPALGPTAFMHRTSAAEIPEAPLGHHLQDSTHIAASVMTVWVASRWWQVEVSTFHGREPDENRWNFDGGAPDSVSARLAFRLGANWALQISHGHLNEPEELEEGDVDRTTASLACNRPLSRGNWATTLLWGRNHRRGGKGNLNSYLLESSLRFLERNYVFGRIENVDREGLFLTDDPETEPIKRVAAFTVGAARDLWVERTFRLALGFNLTLYHLASELKPIYGDHPLGARVFLRYRLGDLVAVHHGH